MNNGNNRIHPLVTVLRPGFDMHPVHERVCKGCSKFLQFGRGQCAADEEELGGINRFSFNKFPGEKVLDCLSCRSADIVGYAREKSDFNRIIKGYPCRCVYQEFLDNRIDQLCSRFQVSSFPEKSRVLVAMV